MSDFHSIINKTCRAHVGRHSTVDAAVKSVVRDLKRDRHFKTALGKLVREEVSVTMHRVVQEENRRIKNTAFTQKKTPERRGDLALETDARCAVPSGRTQPAPVQPLRSNRVVAAYAEAYTYRICGRQVGEMKREDLLHYADERTDQSLTMQRESRFLRLLAEKTPPGKRVDESIPADELDKLIKTKL